MLFLEAMRQTAQFAFVIWSMLQKVPALSYFFFELF